MGYNKDKIIRSFFGYVNRLRPGIGLRFSVCRYENAAERRNPFVAVTANRKPLTAMRRRSVKLTLLLFYGILILELLEITPGLATQSGTPTHHFASGVIG
jgi:hypothetical protein